MSGKRSFQFGLRKLLLWTAVVALLLGLATSLGDWGWFLACWLLFIGVLRAAFGPKVAGILSVAVPVIVACAVAMTRHPGPSFGDLLVDAFLVGAFVGLAMFVIVEGAIGLVNWADKVLGPKSDGEARRD